MVYECAGMNYCWMRGVQFNHSLFTALYFFVGSEARAQRIVREDLRVEKRGGCEQSNLITMLCCVFEYIWFYQVESQGPDFGRQIRLIREYTEIWLRLYS